MLKRLLCLSLLLLLGACGYLPGATSKTCVQSSAITNGEKSLVVMRAKTIWGSPAETRWLHLETGRLVTVTTQFAASNAQKAGEYDMVTLPAGHYALAYVMYSDGTKGVWQKTIDLDPVAADVSPIGQVYIKRTPQDQDLKTTIWTLRSLGYAENGTTPLIAGFSIGPGKAYYLGEMTIQFKSIGIGMSSGYFPAESVAYSISDLQYETAKLQVAQEDPVIAEKLIRHSVTRGTLAGDL